MRRISRPLFLVFLLVFLSLICLSLAPNTSASIQDPYTICGTVTDGDGTPQSGCTVKVENLDTGEANNVGADTITGSAITVTTDSNGRYTFELINLKSGYSANDDIKVTARKGDLQGSETTKVTSGGWGAVVDIEIGEVDETVDWYEWLLSICGTWYGMLGLIVLCLVILWFFTRGRKGRR